MSFYLFSGCFVSLQCLSLALSLLNPHFEIVYSNVPLIVSTKFEMWRFLTAAFTFGNFTEFAFVLFLSTLFLNFYERTKGTFFLAFNFLLITVIFNSSIYLISSIFSVLTAYKINSSIAVICAFAFKLLVDNDSDLKLDKTTKNAVVVYFSSIILYVFATFKFHILLFIPLSSLIGCFLSSEHIHSMENSVELAFLVELKCCFLTSLFKTHERAKSGRNDSNCSLVKNYI